MLWPTFGDFVSWISRTHAQDGPNLHLKMQTQFCDHQHGAHFDLIAKVEHRRVWAARLLKFLPLGDIWRTGWGADGQHTFVSEDAEEAGAVASNDHPDDAVFSDEWTLAERHVCEHYTTELLEQVAYLYVADIRHLGYEDEVARWCRLCGFRHPEWALSMNG